MITNTTMTTAPIAINIDPTNQNMFYSSKQMFKHKPEFYYGCTTKIRNIVRKKNIPESEYIYAYLNKNKWISSNADYKPATLFISKEWVDKHYFKNEPVEQPLFTEEEKEKEKEEENDIIESATVNDVIEENDIIELAPPILKLKDNDKFTDCDGNIIEIETRGEKNYKQIYFNITDISKGFEMPNLNTTILRKRGYKRNIHYKTYFIRSKPVNDQKYTIKKYTYLTYHGLLRVLIVSQNKHVNKFQDWAEQKLFTIQMGSKEEKIKLGTDILNISAKTYKAVFDSYATTLPCIYLLALGKVGQLRETFGIDPSISDELSVYKYGFSDDLSRRIGEHELKYGRLPNVSLKLSTFHIIDVKYTSEAEGEIRELCSTFDIRLSVEGHNELIVLNDKQLAQIKKQYKFIGTQFAGATQEMQNQIADLKDKIKEFENEIANIKVSHKNELLEKDLIIQQEMNETKILKMQIENAQTISGLERQNYTLQIQILTK